MISINDYSQFSKQRLQSFQSYLNHWYALYGRHYLPWRKDLRPYSILVSEMMLQQTQVDRVVPKFESFMMQYPDELSLAKAPLAEVITQWQGLGYNRRAKYLHQTAVQVAQQGNFPSDQASLQELPGIGPYTAGAICAFAFNQSVTLIETNVRTVFLHHFFPEALTVTDQMLLPLISDALDSSNPREWYWAIMDYGSYLKTQLANPSRRSATYSKQSSFTGSRRQVRGIILRELSKGKPLSKKELEKLSGYHLEFPDALFNLSKEGMIQESNGFYTL